jgi:hypothetical protein
MSKTRWRQYAENSSAPLWRKVTSPCRLTGKDGTGLEQRGAVDGLYGVIFLDFDIAGSLLRPNRALQKRSGGGPQPGNSDAPQLRKSPAPQPENFCNVTPYASAFDDYRLTNSQT